jgi:hypothetical protein
MLEMSSNGSKSIILNKRAAAPEGRVAQQAATYSRSIYCRLKTVQSQIKN